MSRSTYYSGYYATKSDERRQLSEIKSEKAESNAEERELAAKTAKYAKKVEIFDEMRKKVADDVNLRAKSSLYTTQQVHHAVPDPNAAFRRQKGKASVYRHLAEESERVKEIGSLYHNPGPGKVWSPEEHEWKTIGDGIKAEGNTPWPEDQEGDAWNTEEEDIPR